MKRRPTPQKPIQKKPSPFSQAARELAETEAKLKLDMETLERQISEAPARKQEQLRRQHTEIMRRHQQNSGSDFFSSIPDKRYQFQASVAAAPRGRRKGEKRAAQYQFVALLVLLAIAIIFLLKMIPWH